jgi:Curli production assembly/transport component CsgG
MILRTAFLSATIRRTQSFNVKRGLRVRQPACTLLTIAVSLLFLFMLGSPPAHAGNEAIEDQVANILYEESAQGKIKVVILDFSVSTAPGEGKLSEQEIKDLGTRFTEEFTAGIMNKIKESGKRERIAVYDRSKLDDALRERKAPATDGRERTILETGRIAGVDVIIDGRIQAAGNSVTATAKVIRVKDGEILDIVKQDKPSSTTHAPVTLLETVAKLEIGSYKAFPLNLPSGGSLDVTVEVLRGNPLDVTVIPGAELENFKERKEFKKVVLLTATKMKSYKRSADLGAGDYYLVVRDASLGVFSVQHSDVKVLVRLAQ